MGADNAKARAERASTIKGTQDAGGEKRDARQTQDAVDGGLPIERSKNNGFNRLDRNRSKVLKPP